MSTQELRDSLPMLCMLTAVVTQRGWERFLDDFPGNHVAAIPDAMPGLQWFHHTGLLREDAGLCRKIHGEH